MATKLEGDPRKEYSAYLESKGLQTPDGKVPEGGKAYVSYQAALKQKGAMTKEEYTRGVICACYCWRYGKKERCCWNEFC